MVQKPRILAVNPKNPDPTVIAQAAGLLAQGGLVAFPTETVYGLGADATNPAALQKIFDAKGRPASNPLIVHVNGLPMARQLVTEWPTLAQKLSVTFWPGPLSLVLKRSSTVPDLVTAGHNTVAIRMPDHPVALALITALGRPIAAPSANRSTGISPTLAQHVVSSLGDKVDLVLDAGPARVGIESSVIDLTGPVPVLLRPGWLTPTMLEQVTEGHVRPSDPASTSHGPDQAARSPGQMALHYAPVTPVILSLPFSATTGSAAQALLIIGHPEAAEMPGPALRRLLSNPQEAAHALYAQLHEWDRLGLERIVIIPPPDTPEWTAILDRLRRAAAPR